MNFINSRIVITGVGLTAPNGNNLIEFRESLLSGKSGIGLFNTRLMGDMIAGVCEFDHLKYQSKKDLKRGTRAGAIGIYCTNEAISNSKANLDVYGKERIGVYVGITDHGVVETEDELFNIKEFDYDVKYWSHHTGPRLLANNPAGEIALNLGIKGPHYTIGAACAAGNIGLIHGVQLLVLNEVDLALACGISEAIRTSCYFANFMSQGALAENSEPEKACRPFDKVRNGVVISEGGGVSSPWNGWRTQ